MEKITTFYRPLSDDRLIFTSLDSQLAESANLKDSQDLIDEETNIPYGIIDAAKGNLQYRILLNQMHVDQLNNNQLLLRWIELTNYSPNSIVEPANSIFLPSANYPEKIHLVKVSDEV